VDVFFRKHGVHRKLADFVHEFVYIATALKISPILPYIHNVV